MGKIITSVIWGLIFGWAYIWEGLLSEGMLILKAMTTVGGSRRKEIIFSPRFPRPSLKKKKSRVSKSLLQL